MSLTNRSILYPQLYQSIQSVCPVSAEVYAGWIAGAQLMRFKKGQLLIAPGSVLRRTYYLLDGTATAFARDQQGNEHIIQFAIEGWWISDLGAFLTGQPAQLQVEAMSDCSVLSFQQDYLEEQFKQHPELQTFFLKLTQKAFLSFQERILDNLALDAEARYLKFAKRYPGLELRFAQKIIASYLGMSPEFLSKIKKRLRV